MPAITKKITTQTYNPTTGKTRTTVTTTKTSVKVTKSKK